jgi:uncharacterized protein YndB with AHSA1/START domain
MAKRHQLVESPPHRVWQVLANGESYARWVVGTQQILHVDPGWPGVGAQLRFEAGFGPIRFADSCIVRISEPEHRLELEAKADPFGTARISFTLTPWSTGTLVGLDEHPLAGPGVRLFGPVSQRLLHLRNRRLLDNLARVAVAEHEHAIG